MGGWFTSGLDCSVSLVCYLPSDTHPFCSQVFEEHFCDSKVIVLEFLGSFQQGEVQKMVVCWKFSMSGL